MSTATEFEPVEINDSAASPRSSLRHAKSGILLSVLSIRGEDATAHRLRELGLNVGRVIEKVADGAAIICRVGSARFAISRELAEQILVR